MLARVLPEDLRHYAYSPIDQKKSTALFGELARRYPEQYADVLSKVSNLAARAVTDYGRDTSPSISDAIPPKEVQAHMKKVRAHIHSIMQKDGVDGETKQRKISEYLLTEGDNIRAEVLDMAARDGNTFALSVKRGIKGNPVQLAQLLAGDMLNIDSAGKVIPIPGVHGYGEGITPAEHLAGAYGSMLGFANVQFMTAKTGYLGKQLALLAGDVKITGKDCGAVDVGEPGVASDPELLGKVMAAPSGNYPNGTLITEGVAADLGNEDIVYRSPLTCQQRIGVCQLCSGKGPNDKFPSLNSYVGVTAANTMSEPLTQKLGLAAKHRGGTAGIDDVNLTGFDQVNQLYQMGDSFKGASLAPVDGTVDAIRKAPQGGIYIKVGGQQVHVPPGRDLLVSKGDTVEAGDPLTDGDLNPRDIVRLKGIGEGRREVAQQQFKILRDNNSPVSLRNSEHLARGFVDYVRITDPDGVQGYTPGKILTYSEMQGEYEPRKGSLSRRPVESTGKYLERPALHYTIGTRVTPRVASELEKYRISNIVVHDKPPGFEPLMQRAADRMAIHQDWKARMAGFGLHRSFLNAVQTGSTSPRDPTNYLVRGMDPMRTLNRTRQVDVTTNDVPSFLKGAATYVDAPEQSAEEAVKQEKSDG